MNFFETAWAGIVDAPGRLVQGLAVAALFVLTTVAFVLIRDWRRHARGSRLAGAAREVFRRDLYRHTTTRADVWNYAFVYAIFLPVIAAFIGVVGAVVSSELVQARLTEIFGQQAVVLESRGAIIAVQAFGLFVGAELGIYVAHLLLHKVPPLWALHRVHHSAEALTFFTRFRDHPLDLMFIIPGRVVGGGLIGGATLFVSGTSIDASAVAIVTGIGMLIPFGPDLWRHCHIPLSFGALNRVFNAPIMHQIHHSAEPRHFDKNLGGELMIFDWLFGTLYLPEKGEAYRWGLNDRELGANNPHVTLRGFYLEPFAYAWRKLKKPGPLAAELEQPAKAPSEQTL